VAEHLHALTGRRRVPGRARSASTSTSRVRPRPAAGGLALLAAIVVAGCSAGAPASRAAAPTSGGSPGSTRPPLPAAVARACADIRTVNNRATQDFLDQVRRAVAADERGVTTARDAAMKQLRVVFARWSASLRRIAAGSTDQKLDAVIIEYAGGVDAAIARVGGPGELEKLSSFDDLELDTAASQLAEVCP
jgi:hypothetical protein